MKTKNLTIVFTILCLVLLESRAALAEWVTVGSWVDTNKKNHDPSNGWILYFSDDDSDTFHDAGEAWGPKDEYPAGYSSWRTDKSCWMASASNMLQYEFPLLYNAETTYTELRDGKVSQIPTKKNPWGEYLPPLNNHFYYTWDDPGYADWVFSSYGLVSKQIATTATDRRGWAWATDDPISWCVQMITANHPVGLGIGWDSESDGEHAITLWGINPETKEISITDSDDDKTSNYVIGYDYYQCNGANQWYLYDKYNFWNSQSSAYAICAVAIPEPATMLLLGLGSLMLMRRRRCSK